ncbi:MAG TPA: transposase [Gaiellaceae bacterium]|nr:transposase [Gaiellaceae bacterium]
MPRPPRPQIPDGIYHVTNRGNRRQPIFLDSHDRAHLLRMLEALARARGWIGLGYCLMPNHYHLVLQTPSGDLSSGMQWLNGRYAQDFNHRHGFDGHLFQGRFYSGVVEGDGHLLELSRYLAWNPVEVGLCRTPQQWLWGSYRAVAGLAKSPVPRFLEVRRVLELFSPRRESAVDRFRAFVNDVPGDRQT